MKKVISKISKIITAFVLATLVILADTSSVSAASKTIKVGQASLLPGYVAGVKFNIKPLSGGGYAYCLNLDKKTASNVTQYLEKEMGAGMTYILENGYPKKSFTGNKKKDFYITQAAVWWYLDDTTGTTYLSKSFKSSGSDSYGLRKYIKKLVTGAKKAKADGYEKPSLNAKVSTKKMTLGSGKKYYISKPIDANAKNITGKYKVTIVDAPKGTIITDTDGNKQTTFSANKKFLVKIPADKVKEGSTENAKVKITASNSSKRAYKYAPKDNSIQPMVVLQPYTKDVSDTITVHADNPKPIKQIATGTIPEKTPSKVTIVKLDEDTKTAVAGATLVVKDATGKEVKRFTTTTSAYTIDNLANGSYTVEEVSAPEGYELSTKKESFTISDSVRTAEVTFYNKAKSSVVSIIKLDKNTNQPVAGAELVVRDETGKEVSRFTSSTYGNTITNLKDGIYTVEEAKAPAGYALSNEQETFILDNTKKIVEVKFYNTPLEKSVIITKLDRLTGNPLAGATLVIRDIYGNEVQRIVSSINGNIITGLSNGAYTVEEVSAPEGYELSNEKESFAIEDTTTNVEVKFYNTPKDRVVTITKIDSATGKTLSGAEIVVLNDLGEEVARFISNDKPYVLRDLADGVYTVQEVSAPEGYFLNEEIQTFTIDNSHLSHQITIKDIPKTCENGGLDDDECSVDVPDTGSNNALFYLLGITIITLGVGYAYKYNKAK